MAHDVAHDMVEYGLRFVGVNYLWGGNNPLLGFDCSGLVCECLRSVGLIGNEDLAAEQLYDRFLPKAVKKEARELDTGDLVFFGRSTKAITHIAVAVDYYRMLESGGGGHTVTDRMTAARYNAFVRVRPVKARGDLIAVLELEFDALSD